jgi:hypothetical protein
MYLCIIYVQKGQRDAGLPKPHVIHTYRIPEHKYSSLSITLKKREENQSGLPAGHKEGKNPGHELLTGISG